MTNASWPLLVVSVMDGPNVAVFQKFPVTNAPPAPSDMMPLPESQDEPPTLVAHRTSPVLFTRKTNAFSEPLLVSVMDEPNVAVP